MWHSKVWCWKAFQPKGPHGKDSVLHHHHAMLILTPPPHPHPPSAVEPGTPPAQPPGPPPGLFYHKSPPSRFSSVPQVYLKCTPWGTSVPRVPPPPHVGHYLGPSQGGGGPSCFPPIARRGRGGEVGLRSPASPRQGFPRPPSPTPFLPIQAWSTVIPPGSPPRPTALHERLRGENTAMRVELTRRRPPFETFRSPPIDMPKTPPPNSLRLKTIRKKTQKKQRTQAQRPRLLSLPILKSSRPIYRPPHGDP